MIILLTGSRIWDDPIPIIDRLNWYWHLTVATHRQTLDVLHGDASTGADRHCRRWCECGFPGVRHHRRPAAWKVHDDTCGRPASIGKCPGPAHPHCKNAGFRRNSQMVTEVARAVAERGHEARVLACIRDGSNGATHCAREAHRAGLVVEPLPWPDNPATKG